MKQIDRLAFEAVQCDDARTLTRALENGADPNLVVDGMPLLHIAAIGGRIELATMLLRLGANPNARDEQRKTAIMYLGAVGCDEAHQAIFGELIRCQAELNARDAHGLMALDYAVRFGNARMVRLLVTQGADCGAASRKCLSSESSDRGRGK